MSFANHNILDIALSIIPPTVVQIRKNQGTVVNKYGQSEASYSEWIEVYGIVQPGAEQNEHTQGVDFSKKRVTIWLRGVALDGTHLQWAPDQIRYVGKIFNVIGIKDWFPYDNYRECECVEAMNLGDGQRGGMRSVSTFMRSVERRRAKPVKKTPDNQQSFAFDMPSEQPSTTAPKPRMFVPQAAQGNDEHQEAGTNPPPVKQMLVGRARIRF